MCKEISPWGFVVNALYFVKGQKPLSLNPKDEKYFWEYTLIAFEKLKSEIEGICVYADRYSLENVLWYDNLYINIKNDNVFIDKSVDIRSINRNLDADIKKKLPKIFVAAYKELQI